MDASTLLLLAILLLLIFFVLGLIAPQKFTTLGGGSPHRGKAFLFYLVPAFFLFLWLGSVAGSVEQAQDDPESVTHLYLDEKGLRELPDYVAKCVNLEVLDLSDNSFDEIPEELKKLSKLRVVDLTNNPISYLPDWLLEMEALDELDLSGTKIDSTSSVLISQLRKADIDVLYEETPFSEVLKSKKADPDSEEADAKPDDEHSEGFLEFAKRKLLYGGEDYRRKYGKGEIYYERGIEKALVDSLGAALTDIGLFTEEKEVTVKLVKVDDLFQVKVVTIYESADDLSVEEEASWQFITVIIAGRTFDGEKMEVHLCDVELNVLKEIPSE